MSASRDKKMRQNAPAASEAATKAMTQQEKDRKKYKTKVVIISVVLVIFVIATLFLSSKALYNKFTAVSFGDEKFTACDVVFYKNMVTSQYYNAYGEYASYYMPDDATITDSAMDLMQSTAALHVAAEKDGFALSEEDQKVIDGYLSSAESASVSNKFDSVDAFLAANYCKGMTAKVYRDVVTYYVYASTFGSNHYQALTYSDDELESYYADHADTLDTFTYSLFNFSTEDFSDPKADAEEFLDRLTKGESFGDLAYEYATDDDKANYENRSSSTGTVSGSSVTAGTELGDFLLDASRVSGDAAVLAGEPDENGEISVYSVAQFVSRGDNKYYTADFRHILVKTEDVSVDDYSTKEEYQAAKEEAKSVAKESAEMYYTLWKENATEDNFISMVSEYSDDTGSTENGGLYEGVTLGHMVSGVEDWLFAEGRKAGDTDIVESSYGYHIMYYVGQSDVLHRAELAENAVKNDDYNAWEEDLIGEDFPAATTAFLKLAAKD